MPTLQSWFELCAELFAGRQRQFYSAYDALLSTSLQHDKAAANAAGGVRPQGGLLHVRLEASSDLGAGSSAARPSSQKQKGLLCTRLRDAQRAPKLLQPRCGQQQTTARARPERAALGEGAKSHFVSVYSKGPKRPRAHANQRARHTGAYAWQRATRTAGTDAPRRFAIV